MGIVFTSSHFISQFPPTQFPLITAIRMCHFLPVHHLGMAFLAGLKTKIQHFFFKKLDGNYTRILLAILNKSWRQHPTRHQLHGHLPPIMKSIQVRRTRHAGHCWRSKDKLISDVLLWTPAYGQAKAGQPA